MAERNRDIPRKITKKQARFVAEYIKDYNATKAALRAGYTEANAYHTGYTLLKKVQVAQEIDKFNAKIGKEAEVERKFIVDSYIEIAKSDITEYLRIVGAEDGKPITTIIDLSKMPGEKRRAIKHLKLSDKGHVLNIELFDKMPALAALERFMPKDTGTKQSIEINIDFDSAKATPEDVEKYLEDDE